MLKKLLRNLILTIVLMIVAVIVVWIYDGIGEVPSIFTEGWQIWIALPFALTLLSYFFGLKRKAYNYGRYGNTAGKTPETEVEPKVEKPV